MSAIHCPRTRDYHDKIWRERLLKDEVVYKKLPVSPPVRKSEWLDDDENYTVWVLIIGIIAFVVVTITCLGT